MREHNHHKFVVLGSRQNVAVFMAEHNLDYGDVVTAHGMIAGRSFNAEDVIVLDSLDSLMETPSMREHFIGWLSHVVLVRMRPGERAKLPELLNKLVS